MKLERIFGSKRPIVGALHFSPMLGYPGFQGTTAILEKAFVDLNAFEKGGVDAVILENNYDLPHRITVGHETVAMMTFLSLEIKRHTNLPLGINVLWNDYEAGISIAKVSGLKFVRVPVFVDDVQTSFGDIFCEPEKIIAYRRKLLGEEIALLTDIHVKHAKMLAPNKSLEVSVKQAIENGSDCLIVTGKWTGDAPRVDDLAEARKVAGSFPIFVGSGSSEENVSFLLEFADGVIVSTSLKSGRYLTPEENRNLKDYHEVVDVAKVRQFVTVFRQVTGG